VSYPQVSPTKPCMHFSPIRTTCPVHLLDVITRIILMRSTDHTVRCCIVLFTPLSPRLSQAHRPVFFSALSPKTLSVRDDVSLRTPTEIRSPAHRKLIGCSMTVPLPVLSPSSILPPPSSHCVLHFRKEKFGIRLKNVII
jgi:hypothetical protein